MCLKLKEEDAMELRSGIKALLRKAKAPQPNLTRQKSIGLAQLKKGKDRVILTADKGVAMVVYGERRICYQSAGVISPAAHRVISMDPTNKIKAQLITKPRN